MSVTIRTIAKLSGVSVSTVSRVLNNNPAVSDEVRKKVQSVIRRQNFVPHAGRANLAHPASNAIGLLIRGTGNLFFVGMEPYLETAAAKYGYTLIIKQLTENDDEMSEAPVFVKEKNLKGLILLGGKFSFSRDEISRISVPSVCCTFTNGFGNVDEKSYSSICADDICTGYKAVTYLIENGHRNIACLVRDIGDRSISELRYKGYVRALSENGIPLNKKIVFSTGDYTMKSAYETTLKLVESGEKFTRIFTASDEMGVAAMRALYEKEIRVPDDVSVIGVDGIDSSLYTIPSLTTMKQPADEMARGAVETLNCLISGGCDYRHTVVDVALREGGSVRNIR